MKELIARIDELYAKATQGEWKLIQGFADWGMPKTETIVPERAKDPWDYTVNIAEFPSVQPYCSGAKPEDVKRSREQSANAEITTALHNAWPQIRDALEKMSGDAWIPVSERKPEHGEVLIYIDGEWGKGVATTYFADGEFQLYDEWVTHWQPLPEPPDEARKGER